MRQHPPPIGAFDDAFHIFGSSGSRFVPPRWVPRCRGDTEPSGRARLIVEGDGMIASAFRRYGDPSIAGFIFARGVADSSTSDSTAFERERAALELAIRRAELADEPLVFFSSAPVYGRFDGAMVRETAPLRPTSSYGHHKAACEERVRGGLAPSLILRLPNVVGPGGNPRQLIPAIVGQVLAGSVTVVEGAARDILDVEDVVSLTQQLIAADAPALLAPLGRTINVASGISTPALTIVRHVAAILGRTPIVRSVEGGDVQRFDVTRLAALVPMTRFGSDYPNRVLARYVPVLAERLL